MQFSSTFVAIKYELQVKKTVACFILVKHFVIITINTLFNLIACTLLIAINTS